MRDSCIVDKLTIIHSPLSHFSHQCNLAKGIDKDNVVDVLLLADKYNANGLKSVAMKYIVDKHMIQEMNVERMKSNPDLLALVLEAVLKARPL